MIKSLLVSISLSVAAVAGAGEPGGHPGASAFVDEVVTRHAMNREQVEALLDDAERRQDIIDLMTRPAEGKPWHEYRPIFITDKRIDAGLEFWNNNEQLLAEAEKTYQVPAEVIVAIIGVETFYGRITGNHRVIDALATLAFHYPPRSKFFRSELEQYLLLGREESLPLTEITGSYAGAMGIGQFISSSYRHYAVDGDADGQRDLWGSRADAIASVANYFARHKWHYGEPVVSATEQRNDAKAISKPPKKPEWTVAQLRDWGYTPTDSVEADRPVTLVKLDYADGPRHYAAYHNFYVITRYNRSPLYAMAVHQLSQALKNGRNG